MEDGPEGEMRLDKWLWVARFYKTRGLAVEGINGGKVTLNGERAKPAKLVRPGDTLRVRHGPLEWQVTVRGLSPRRGPAAEAALLYEEDETVRQARAQRAEQVRLMQVDTGYESGRPSKKDRRAIERLRRRDG